MSARMLALAGLLATLLIAPAAARADVKPFGTLNCAPQGGVRFCPGQSSLGNDQRIKSFDGVPLDTDVALPASGDSNLPLVVLLHGWGGSKVGFDQMQAWAARGYAVLSYTARGFNGSCGRPDNRLFDPAGCATGWLHLADVRYEARDTQFLAGQLADQGLIDGQRIGVTGASYGGGQSMELAALKDRYMRHRRQPAPVGQRRRATRCGSPPRRRPSRGPTSPTRSSPTAARSTTRSPARPTTTTPLGVAKQSFVSGLYALGAATGYYSPPGVDPSADLTTQFARVNAGEPDDATAAGDRQRDHDLPLGVLPRPLRGARRRC